MNFDFPKLPPAKVYGEKATPEQDVMMRLLQGQKLTAGDEDVLKEAIEFYKEAFKFLKSVDLTRITDKDVEQLSPFLKSTFNMILTIQNKINFYNIFRVSFVRDQFLEKGKVRDLKFIMHPPLDIIQKGGVYGRANSPNSTIFYCSFHPGVAVFETKPEVGQRIIIAHWHNENAKDFTSYPITNNRTIDNESLKSATKAFDERMKYNHPLFAKILDLYLEFLSSEFVKDVKVINPKKYEYLFSSYFADMVLGNGFDPYDHPTEPIKHYDCIIYPSIAVKHKAENLGIVPASVSKLKPYHLEESIVVKTIYDDPDLSEDKLPITRRVLRTASKFDGNKIIWDDDK